MSITNFTALLTGKIVIRHFDSAGAGTGMERIRVSPALLARISAWGGGFRVINKILGLIFVLLPWCHRVRCIFSAHIDLSTVEISTARAKDVGRVTRAFTANSPPP